MVINHERRWVYLGPPKTGSTTLTYLLTDGNDWSNRRPTGRSVFGGSKTSGQHAMDVPAPCHDFLIFASIRNPYSRAVSLWWQWNIQSERTKGLAVLRFEEFLERILEWQTEPNAATLPGNGFYHFTLARWFKWVPEIHHFIRQESLSEDLNGLKLAEAVFAPLQNSAPDHSIAAYGNRVPGDWPRFYSPRAVDLVREWGREDFERLGYSYDFPERVG